MPHAVYLAASLLLLRDDEAGAAAARAPCPPLPPWLLFRVVSADPTAARAAPQRPRNQAHTTMVPPLAQ